MLLSDRDIKNNIYNLRTIGIHPYDDSLLQPSSVDVQLDNEFRIFNNHEYEFIDPTKRQGLTSLVKQKEFILHPGEFVLASTLQKIVLPNFLSARLEGKSSLGRLGLMIHSTAGFIDPGFRGTITLELSNVATLPIKLKAGMKIGQLCFFQMSSQVDHPYGSEVYGSKYQGQIGPTSSRFYENFEESEYNE